MSAIRLVPRLLSAPECEGIRARCAAIGYTTAPVRFDSGTLSRPSLRDNWRVEFADPRLAAELYARILAALGPEALMVMAAQSQAPLGLRSWFRGYRYEPGQRFGKHRDKLEAAEGGISRITALFYLNETPHGSGATLFHPERGSAEPLRRVEPQEGAALLFASGLLHEGERLADGEKLVLRSDILFPLPAAP